MKQGIVLVMLCLQIASNAQTDTSYQGIQWETGLSWQKIKAKAEKENKYIMVDCFATWCGPCKEMEKDIYPSKEVGDYFNSHFINVKIQMDKTNKDSIGIRNWYQEAANIKQQYNVSVFPTYLFFSPDGKIVHKAAGAYPEAYFIGMATDALDPHKQYYSLLGDYQRGKRDTSDMYFLAIQSSSFEDNALATEIADDYLSIQGNKIFETEKNIWFLEHFKKSEKAIELVNIYINSLDSDQLFTIKNIRLMAQFVRSSKDKIFNIFYNNASRVDKVIQGNRVERAGTYTRIDFAEQLFCSIILHEETASIQEKIKKANAPVNVDWRAIRQDLSKKYNDKIAQRCVLQTKLFVYKYYAQKFNKYWKEYIDSDFQNIEKYIADTSGYSDAVQRNNFCYDVVFFHSNDKNQIDKAIKLMSDVIKRHPQIENIDTYANLLYKGGRKIEAMEWENKAIQVAIKAKEDEQAQDFQNTLGKMEKGQPTWLMNN